MTGGDAGSPAVGSGVVVVPEGYCYTAGGLCQHLRGLNQWTGATLWTKTIPASSDLAPILAGSTVYYSTDTAMTAISVTTGKTIWSASAIHGAYAASPAFQSGELVAPADSGGALVALSSGNGKVLWADTSNAFAVTYTPLIAAGSVFGGGEAPGFSGFGAWNAASGAPIWSDTNVDPTTPPTYDSANGIVYVGTDGGLVAFNATNGTPLWTADSGQSITGSPSVANGVVYYGAGTTMLAADAGSGATLWSQSTTSTVKNSPMIVNGRLFFTTDDGALHAYHL
jgi:outer membrane protein assembly factor BamB